MNQRTTGRNAVDGATVDGAARHRRGLRSTEAGFTLLELMAVIVILGILIAVLVPRLGKAKSW